jgi:Family of unknown function (DUF6502)
MSSPAHFILLATLAAIRPLIRLLVRNGITYTVLVAALKESFIEAAHQEFKCSSSKPASDSAISLLSGVHRRDIRNLTRKNAPRQPPLQQSISASSQLVARWLSAPEYADNNDQPAKLPRSGTANSFDALAMSISSDVRPRAILDDLIRLGLAKEDELGVELVVQGFIPRTGFKELTEQYQNNLHDHIAAASANLMADKPEKGFLEQAVFVDQLSQESAHHLHTVATQAWRSAFKLIMREAQARFDHDQVHTKKSKRRHRARFGVYFYASDED